MATPVGFQGADGLLSGETVGVNDLPVFIGNGLVISCWRLSEDELKTVAETGVVWLAVMGNTAPPVKISGNALVSYNLKPSRAEPVLPMRTK